MNNEERVKSIKIGNGKYLLLINWHRPLQEGDGYIAQKMTEGLAEWWKGDEKFFSISVGDDADITFERAE